MIEYVKEFEKALNQFSNELGEMIVDKNGEWVMKGLVDIDGGVYTITTDTKAISKMLELHLQPHVNQFAESIGYRIELATQQNWYPDLTFINKKDESIKFAVDIKTTYRKKGRISGFTLGSHGTYFKQRDKKKNIQYTYNEYTGHYCIGIIYNRIENYISKKKTVNELDEITSTINDFDIFASPKWKIASDTQGSGNTANIGSINNIDNLKNNKGVFSELGVEWFDEYWMNYGMIKIIKNGKPTPIRNIFDYLEFKGRTDLFDKVVGKKQ